MMIGTEFLKLSMTNLLIKMMGIKLDCEDPQTELEHFYNRY
jgi:hypothetical protein